MKIRTVSTIVAIASVIIFTRNPFEAHAFRGLASLQGHTTGEPLLWRLSGEDKKFGAYEGELRMGSIHSDGSRVVQREIHFLQFQNQNKAVAVVWDGIAKKSSSATGEYWSLNFTLKRAGFLNVLPDFKRDLADNQDMQLTAAMSADLSDAKISWDEVGEKDYLSTAERLESGEPQPTLKVELRELSHPIFGMTELLKFFAHRFEKDPLLKKFQNNPTFKSGIQYGLRDTTNYEYYQKKPQTLRVVNQVLNPASLAEEFLRYDAYSESLKEKAKHYDHEVPTHDLNQYGLLGNEGDSDTALWTGQYIASQFFRYQVTQDPSAIDNTKRAASALVKISKDPIASDKDILSGLVMGLLFSYEILPASEDSLKKEISVSIQQLADSSRVMKSNVQDELLVNGAAYLISGEQRYKSAYLDAEQSIDSSIFRKLHLPKELGGISDWTANNRSLVSDILRVFIAHHMDSKDLGVALQSSYSDWKDIANYRMAPHIFFLKGEEFSNHLVDASKIEDAIWSLREFPGSKPVGAFQFDHSNKPDFVLSPYPSQPWVSSGYQGLVAYPLFQSSALTSQWVWSESPFTFSASQPVNASSSGADYLFAYWLGRYYGAVSPSE
jgi:hypothetical protein